MDRSDVGVAERERRLQVFEGVGVGVERRGVVGGEPVVLGGAGLVAGQAQVLGHERCPFAGGRGPDNAAATRACSSCRRASAVRS